MATDKEITGQWNLSYVTKKTNKHFFPEENHIFFWKWEIEGLGNMLAGAGGGGTAVSYGKGWEHSYSRLTFFFSILEVFS